MKTYYITNSNKQYMIVQVDDCKYKVYHEGKEIKKNAKSSYWRAYTMEHLTESLNSWFKK